MAKSKLKDMLAREQGRNFTLEKQRKKEKEAQKRRAQKNPEPEEVGDELDEEEAGGVSLVEVSAPKANGKAKKNSKSKKNGKPKKAEEEEWKTDDSEGDDDSEDLDDDDMPERATLDMSRFEDSDSEGSSEDDADDAAEDEDEEDEDEEDIPLSDIEDLAEEDKGDVIPHQRLTINNTSALLAAVSRIQLPYSKLPFSEYQVISSDEIVDIPDVEDDLNRELAFYKQALEAVKYGREKLKKEGVPFSRPVDYFAEMVKSDEHMGKIKQKLVDEAAGKKAAAEARKQRDLKKFGKQVQVAKLQERAKEKRDTLEKINTLKRKRQGAELTTTNEEDLFDVELDNATTTPDRRRGDGKPTKRAKKDAKFGFGGKKRFAKSNDAKSSADGSSYSLQKMRAAKTGASKRLGKSRRAKRA